MLKSRQKNSRIFGGRIMPNIQIQALDKEEVVCIKAIEDEGKYFVLLEITKDKYEEIKEKIKQAQGEQK